MQTSAANRLCYLINLLVYVILLCPPLQTLFIKDAQVIHSWFNFCRITEEHMGLYDFTLRYQASCSGRPTGGLQTSDPQPTTFQQETNEKKYNHFIHNASKLRCLQCIEYLPWVFPLTCALQRCLLPLPSFATHRDAAPSAAAVSVQAAMHGHATVVPGHLRMRQRWSEPTPSWGPG